MARFLVKVFGGIGLLSLLAPSARSEGNDYLATLTVTGDSITQACARGEPPTGLVTYLPASAAVDESWEGIWPFEAQVPGRAFAPPDPHGAVGPYGILASTNIYVAYYNRDGTRIWPTSEPAVRLWELFQQAQPQGCECPDGDTCSDPKVVYDRSSGRFYIVLHEFKFNPQSGLIGAWINLAVSKTNNPTTADSQSWWLYRLAAVGQGSTRPDFPTVAVDDQALYISYNMWHYVGGFPPWSFSHPQLFIISKADINAGVPSPQVTTKIITGNQGVATVAPVTSIGPGAPSNLIYLVQSNGCSQQILLWALTDPMGAALLSGPMVLGENLIHTGGAPLGEVAAAPQPNGRRLQSLAGRTCGRAFWLAGSVWFCNTTGDGESERFKVYYYRINPNGYPLGSPTITEWGGLAGDLGEHYYMPAIGGNARGDVCLVFTRSSATSPPAILYAVRRSWATGFQTPQVVKQSTYSLVPSVGEWGDYGVACADPVDESFWISHEWVRGNTSSRTDWGTWWGRIPTEECPSPQVCGRWETIPPGNWPTGLAPAHMALTYTGRVLMWRDTKSGSVGAHYWDPVTLTNTPLALTHADSTYLGAGHVAMGDGRIAIVGGTYSPGSPPPNPPVGLRASAIFDPAFPGAFIRRPSMAYPRTSPAAVILPDARILGVSGWKERNLLANIPEVYLASWSSLALASKNDMSLHPFMYLDPSPNGSRVLYVGPGTNANAIEPPYGTLQPAARLGDLDAAYATWSSNVADYEVRGGAFVSYNTGKVLKTGGTVVGGGSVTNQAELMLVDPSTGSVNAAPTTWMYTPRSEHQLVALPDGTALAVGGSQSDGGPDDLCADGVFETESWSPMNGLWRKLAPMTHRDPDGPRMYQSTGLLLPDARVLVAGGYCDYTQMSNADFFCPPYLFRSDSTLIGSGDRPSISGSPPLSNAYEYLEMSVSFGSGATRIRNISLVRPGATTNSTDMDQRCLLFNACTPPCSESQEFIAGPGNLITIPEMPRPAAAPPGYYMLYLINDLGHPSDAKFVLFWQIAPATVAHALVLNPGGTFTVTVTWRTTAKAVEGDELQLFPPGGGNSITVTGTPSDPEGLVHSLAYTGTCTPQQQWTYLVRSKRPKYGIGDHGSVSESAPKTFKPTACLE